MKVKFLHSFGLNDINEFEDDLPEMRSDQIMIETKLCGICRSDILAYSGHETPMPLMTQGHEGLGVVVKVGSKLKNRVKEGDIVSTWSDPAYADYYYADEKQFTIVPEISSKYILQPVACAINIFEKTLVQRGITMANYNEKILLIGTGFMSVIIAQYAKFTNCILTIAGSANKEHFNKIGFEPIPLIDIRRKVIEKEEKRYTTIIDLSSKAENFYIITKELAALEALICYAATPTEEIKTNFFENCWNCHTFIMPSPRNKDFPDMMTMTCNLIQCNQIDPSFIWTKGYDRHNIEEVKQAFEDGTHRTPDYVRGYLKW